MYFHIIIRAPGPRDQTPTSMYKYRTPQESCLLLFSVIFISSIPEEYFSVVKTPISWTPTTTPNPQPWWIITVCSYSLKGQEKRFVSPPHYTVSHSYSLWCLGGDDRAVCSFPPRLPDPLPPPSPTSISPSVRQFLTQQTNNWSPYLEEGSVVPKSSGQ